MSYHAAGCFICETDRKVKGITEGVREEVGDNEAPQFDSFQDL